MHSPRVEQETVFLSCLVYDVMTFFFCYYSSIFFWGAFIILNVA